MKKILASVGVVAIAGVLSYPGFGFLVEKGLVHQINAMPKQYGMVVELKDFKRHWFSSDVSLIWKWDVPAHLKQNLQGQTITVSPKHYEKEIPIQIFHGPIVVHHWKPFFGVGYASTTLKWPFQAQPSQSIEFAENSVLPVIHVRMALDFLMHTHWKTEVPPFELISKDQSSKIAWGGLTLKNTLTSNLDKIKGQLNLIHLAIKKQQEVIDVKELNTEYHFRLNPVGIYVGDAKMNLLRLDMGQALKLEKFKMENQAEINNDLFSTRFEAQVQSAAINGFEVGASKVDLKIGQINATALAKAQGSLYPQQNASPSFRNKGFLGVITTIPELLKYGAKLDIDTLHLSLKNGTIDLNMKLELPADAQRNSLMNLAQMQSLMGEAHLSLTQALLVEWLADLVEKQLQSQQQLGLEPNPTPSLIADYAQAARTRTMEKIDYLVQSGVILKNHDQYVFDIKLQNGQLTINNLSFDPTWLVI